MNQQPHEELEPVWTPATGWVDPRVNSGRGALLPPYSLHPDTIAPVPDRSQATGKQVQHVTRGKRARVLGL